MADKKLNAVSTASDGAYVYAEDASGNQIKISKADLASVVAGKFMLGALSKTTDIDGLKGFGFYSAGGIQHYSLPTGYGILMCFQTKGWYDRIQIFFPTDTATSVFFRIATETGGFGTWRQLAFTV